MRTKKKSLIVIVLLALIATAGVLVHRAAFAKETEGYRFTTVERGSVKATVSATGTIDAVRTVSVGTQVSGQIAELFVDYNDRVKKGQLLARIDSSLARQAVADAQANLEKAQAQALQSSREFHRNRELEDAGLIAQSALEQTQSASQVASASVKSARIALERAQQNLGYTNIYAPIDGVVVARNVDEGQTVAASLSAPELFKIANDLSQMQILAQVGESDIAQIHEALPVEFTVQALPGQTFKGTVKQVRLQSATQDNVVNYTVVVSVDNTSGKLLPGMTARASFLTKSADDVLKVANSALRFKPSAEELEKLKANRTQKNANTTTNTTSISPERRAQWAARRANGGGNGSSTSGTLYYLDANGKLAAMRVRTGITDGTTTEVRGRELKEGMKIIAGTNAATQNANASASPFQSGNQQQQGRRAPGAF
ncbi:MAG TPA: efflux RND transporter periplasmic adaptor subunit [Thermoanaerobaculia bacterium]|nr:efflux RND transporter periplasmic adaptor subunit [Thermoanaerobaculia bacterium]